jgi:hypothetical protein
MGNCFWILVWDGFGLGLHLLSPRMYEVYDEHCFRATNSFSYQTEQDIEDFLAEHEIQERFGPHFKVIKTGD